MNAQSLKVTTVKVNVPLDGRVRCLIAVLSLIHLFVKSHHIHMRGTQKAHGKCVLCKKHTWASNLFCTKINLSFDFIFHETGDMSSH